MQEHNLKHIKIKIKLELIFKKCLICHFSTELQIPDKMGQEIIYLY